VELVEERPTKQPASSTSPSSRKEIEEEAEGWVDDPLWSDSDAANDFYEPSMAESIKLGPNGSSYWKGDILVHENYGFCELAGWRYKKDKKGQPQLYLQIKFKDEMVEFGEDRWHLFSLKARGYELRRIGGKKMKLAQYNVQVSS